MSQNPNASNDNIQRIFQRSFDPTTDRLRVDTAATIEAGQMQIDVNHTEDSIRLGDGTNLTSVTSQGELKTHPRPQGFSVVAISTSVLVQTSSTQLLAANLNRAYAHITNNNSTPVYIQYGANAVIGRGIRLNGGAMFTISGSELFLGKITAISSIPNLEIDVFEGEI